MNNVFENGKEKEIAEKVIDILFDLPFSRAIDIMNIVTVMAVMAHNKEFPEERESLKKSLRESYDSIMKCIEKS